VFKSRELCKEEFIIFLAYVQLLQAKPSITANPHTLKAAFTADSLQLPKFKGIDLPTLKK